MEENPWRPRDSTPQATETRLDRRLVIGQQHHLVLKDKRLSMFSWDIKPQNTGRMKQEKQKLERIDAKAGHRSQARPYWNKSFEWAEIMNE